MGIDVKRIQALNSDNCHFVQHDIKLVLEFAIMRVQIQSIVNANANYPSILRVNPPKLGVLVLTHCDASSSYFNAACWSSVAATLYFELLYPNEVETLYTRFLPETHNHCRAGEKAARVPAEPHTLLNPLGTSLLCDCD